jgi:hypothetical protein
LLKGSGVENDPIAKLAASNLIRLDDVVADLERRFARARGSAKAEAGKLIVASARPLCSELRGLFQQLVDAAANRSAFGDGTTFVACFSDGTPVAGDASDPQIAAGRAALASEGDGTSETSSASQRLSAHDGGFDADGNPVTPAARKLQEQLDRHRRRQQAAAEAAERHPPQPTGPPDARERARRWERLFPEDDE